jgi:hypothetical protein
VLGVDRAASGYKVGNFSNGPPIRGAMFAISSTGLGELLLSFYVHGFDLSCHLYTGGGYCRSTVVWRLGGAIWGFAEAGES